MTDAGIKTFYTLTTEGWYWMADTSDCDASWVMGWVSGEARDGVEGTEGFNEASWASSSEPDAFEEYELSSDYVFLGPVEEPSVAIPIAIPRVPKMFENVDLPTLTKWSNTPPLTLLKR
jgi:hypothetical protein